MVGTNPSSITSVVKKMQRKTELKFTNDRYSEPFNCKFHKVKSSSDS